MFCTYFESFKLTMGLKLMIVVVLISSLILFFHFLVYYHNRERKVHLGMRFVHYQLGLGLNGIRDGTGRGWDY